MKEPGSSTLRMAHLGVCCMLLLTSGPDYAEVTASILWKVGRLTPERNVGKRNYLLRSWHLGWLLGLSTAFERILASQICGESWTGWKAASCHCCLEKWNLLCLETAQKGHSLSGSWGSFLQIIGSRAHGLSCETVRRQGISVATIDSLRNSGKDCEFFSHCKTYVSS